MSGLTASAPAMKPASNFLMRSVSTPPMKPIVPVWLFRAAAAPTRNEPCSSANSIEATFCSGTSSEKSSGVPWSSTATASMRPNSWSGFSTAAACSAGPQRKPTPMTRSWPSATRPARRSARSPSLDGVDSRAGGAELLDGLVEAGSGGVVERAVAAAGDVEQQADGRVLDGRCGRALRRRAVRRLRALRGALVRCFRAVAAGRRGLGAAGSGLGGSAVVSVAPPAVVAAPPSSSSPPHAASARPATARTATNLVAFMLPLEFSVLGWSGGS